jgi:hypothetical protein
MFDRGKASRRMEEKKSERKDKKKDNQGAEDRGETESKTDPSLRSRSLTVPAPRSFGWG